MQASPSPDQKKELLLEKHIAFIANYGKSHDKYEYEMSDFLRMSGIYWSITHLDLCDALDKLDRNEIIDFVKRNQHECGGFRPSDGHDAHLLYTLSAIQILSIYDVLHEINKDRLIEFICSLQQPDGSFAGDSWGEIDTRFSFCAVASLTLLNALDRIDKERAVEFVMSCRNFDGGFGCVPGAESHAGQIYCCIGFLSIMGRLDLIDCRLLGWWLAERQLESGGLNGRPEKLVDVCYSWWVIASLKIIGKLEWIDATALRDFILTCQDEETGGIADRTGNMPDPFHTLFGVAGLSLINAYPDTIKAVNPVFCMPQYVIDRLKIDTQLL